MWKSAELENRICSVVCIIDRSGSMQQIRDDTVGGLNAFIAQQKELPGDAIFTAVLFNEGYEVLFNGIDINDVPEFNNSNFIPQGTTALLDAIGNTICMIDSLIASMRDKPRVIVAIMTDGMENASREYTLDTISNMISTHRSDDYEFIFLAANQDAIQTGSTLGISGSGCITYTADSTGVAYMSSNLSSRVSSFRGVSYDYHTNSNPITHTIIGDHQ